MGHVELLFASTADRRRKLYGGSTMPSSDLQCAGSALLRPLQPLVLRISREQGSFRLALLMRAEQVSPFYSWPFG